HAAAQQVPQRRRVVCAAGQAASHADDGHRLGLGPFQRCDAGLRALEGNEGFLQRVGYRLGRSRVVHSGSTSRSMKAVNSSAERPSRKAKSLSTGGGGGGEGPT